MIYIKSINSLLNNDKKENFLYLIVNVQYLLQTYGSKKQFLIL